MPYSESHEIEIGPITLPAGVRVDIQPAFGTGGLQSVTVVGVTGTSKDDTVALLQAAFAGLMTAASAEGVGAPVFVSSAPAVAPAATVTP